MTSKAPPPTLRHVAKFAGVSAATASFVLRDHPKAKSFSRETIDSVTSAARELGYQANFFSSQLRRSNSQLVMVYMDTLQDLYSSAIAESFQRKALELGYWTMINVSPKDRRGGLIDRKIIGRHGISAVILLAGVVDHLTKKDFQQLEGESLRVVTVGREFAPGGVSQILVDDARGGRLAARHVYELGARRVWVMCNFESGNVSRQARYRGVIDYARENGLPEPVTIELEDEPVGPDESLPVHIGRQACEAVRRRLATEPPPEAIITNLDLRALPLYQALGEAGLRPGHDVAVIGYDDIWPAQMAAPMLTSIHQPTDEMGRLAAEVLIDRLEERIATCRTITLEPKLVVRDSTALWRPGT